ncbi:2-(1,2-epoxy-1,2-dihydrophenyl)acetyl-CoA isomerase PaaG [Pseudomonas sp. MDT1-85]
MNSENILFSVDQGVAVVVLNRADQFNSFTADMHEQLRLALALVRQDPGIRALLLTGKGRAFCAGQDLASLQINPDGTPANLGDLLEHDYNPLIRALRDLPIPVICAVNGVAAGAGASIALAADLVIAARSASFIQAFGKVGLIPDSGVSWVLPRLIGSARAKALFMLGERISAEQAQQWGMIWRCVDDSELADEALLLARHLATQPTYALGLLKRCMDLSQQHSLDQQLETERELQTLAGHSEDFSEGLNAFIEKRSTHFKGR